MDVRLAIAGVSVDERIRRGALFPMRRCAPGQGLWSALGLGCRIRDKTVLVTHVGFLLLLQTRANAPLVPSGPLWSASAAHTCDQGVFPETHLLVSLCRRPWASPSVDTECNTWGSDAMLGSRFTLCLNSHQGRTSVRRAGEGMYRVARQAQQPLQRSASGSSAGLPPSYPISAAASRSDTEDGGSSMTPVSILRRYGPGTRGPQLGM